VKLITFWKDQNQNKKEPVINQRSPKLALITLYPATAVLSVADSVQD
jgi:hypothetical protein